MKRPVIVADDRIPFLQGVLEPYCDVTYLPGGKIDRNAVRNADAVITRTRTRCNAELLEGSTVRLITTATIGFDHIDTDYVKKAVSPGSMHRVVMPPVSGNTLPVPC